MPQRDPTTGRFVAADDIAISGESTENAEFTGFCEWCEEEDARAVRSIPYQEGTTDVCANCVYTEGVSQCAQCHGDVLADGFISIKAWVKNRDQANLRTAQQNMCHSCTTQNHGIHKDPVFGLFLLPPDPAVFPETVQITDARTGRT